MSFTYIDQLPTPDEIKQEFPLSETARAAKIARDKEISAVIRGESDKFLVIIGPCSADNETSVMDYIKQKGAELAKVTEGKLTAVLVRAGVSWKDVATTLADAFDGITNGHYHATLSKDATDASNLYKKKNKCSFYR